MKAARSKSANIFFRNEYKSRILLKELKINDNFNGKSIKTIFGLIKKL